MVVSMDESTVTEKGQVTIPVRMRKMLGMRKGEKVIFEADGDKVIVRRAEADPVDDMVGLGVGVFEKSVEYQRRLRAEWGS